jgi:hypothetical protein
MLFDLWPSLAALLARSEPREAATLLLQALRMKTLETLSETLYPSQELAAVAGRLSATEAREVAGILIEILSTKTQPRYLHRAWETSLAQALARTPAPSREDLLASATGAVGLGTSPGLLPLTPAIVVSAQKLKPQSKLLPPRMLVDLLKHPLCVGELRRAVLDALGKHLDRTFADQWEFVRFATDQQLDLDLTSPPKRPALAGLQ